MTLDPAAAPKVANRSAAREIRILVEDPALDMTWSRFGPQAGPGTAVLVPPGVVHAFDSSEPPADGGRPASEAVIAAGAAGGRSEASCSRSRTRRASAPSRSRTGAC